MLHDCDITRADGEESTALFGDGASLRCEAALRLGLDGTDLMAAASPGAGFPEELVALTAELSLAPGDRVVDIGGGMGGAAAWIARHTGALVAVAEPAAGATAAARRLFPDIPTIRADGRELPIQDASVDAACLFGVLSLLDDALPLLTEAARILRPGRALVINDLVASSDTVLRSGPNTFRSLRVLSQLADRVGFDVDEAHQRPDGLRTSWSRVAERVAQEIQRSHPGTAAAALLVTDKAHLEQLTGSSAVKVGSLVVTRRS